MKKMLVLLLTLCLLAGLVPLGAGAVGTLPSASDGTITLTGAISGDQTISENNVTLDGSNLSFTNGKLTVTADNVTIKNLTFGDGTSLIVTTTGKFTLTDCKFEPSTVYSNSSGVSSGVRTAAYIKAKDAVITNNIFGGIDNGYFNAIEFGINNDTDLASATISNNQFTKTIQNNYFNFYNLAENAVIEIDDNQMLLANKASNGIRISNNKNVSATFNVDRNTYSYSSSSTESKYEGLILLQDYAKGDEKQDFTKIKINITNLTSPSDAKQLFYVYDDQDGIINTNQPALSGDSSLEKFSVASIDSTYYPSVQGAISAATPGATVTLLRNAMFDTLSLSTGSVTVDLNGYTLTSNSGKTSDVTNSSKLTIQDSRGTGKLVYNGFRDPAQAAFEIQAGSSITLNGTHYETSGTGVFARGDAAIVNVQDTVIDSKGYCVGTNAGEDENYNVAIRITDGSVLTSALEGAGTAVLFNVPGTLDIENSTLNGHWQGIIARGGTITVRNSVITNTYDKLNTSYEDKWGTGNAVTVAGIAIGNKGEENDGYNFPVSVTLENTSVTSVGPNPAIYVYQMEGEKRTVTVKISGDSAVSGDFIVKKDEKVEKVDVSISGGYFTSDPSEYCAEGYYAGESDNAAYAYQVKEGKAGTEPAKVVAAEPDVKAAENIPKSVTNALSGTEATLDAAAKEQAAKNTVDTIAATTALTTAGIATGGKTVTVVVQPYLAMEAKSYDSTKGTMTVDIKAMYRTVATTADLDGADAEDIIVSGEEETGETANAVVIGEKENTLPVKGSVEISIPLPDGFVSNANPIFVQHKNIYEYKAKVTSDGGATPTYTATFTNPHGFSTFVLSTETKAVATVNDTDYTNFQQAVEDAGANGTVTVQKGGQTATGVTYNLTLKNDGTDSITVTINGEKITINAGETKNFIYTAPTPPRPTEEKHSITISTDGKGQVTGPASAAEDDKVTLTVKPGADKELYDLKVTDEDGKAIAVTKVNDTTYTFTMPDGKVTVAATFGCDGNDNCPSKAFTDLGDKQWYHDSIDYAVENGLLEGTSPTTMEPNATLIRAQLAQILYNIEDKPAVTGEMIFEDVPASEWFYSPILWANQNDIINGTSPTTFEPLEDISRQDLALMLYRYAGEPKVTGDLDGFTDADQVGDWAEEAMAWAVAEGIVLGDTPTTLNPTGTATRAEAAAMLQRFLEDAA